jgi:hypothetical protein
MKNETYICFAMPSIQDENTLVKALPANNQPIARLAQVPTVSISWKSTTQKFHSISDLVGTFGTEGEAVAFAAQAGKAWVDSHTPVPAADAVKNTPRRRSRKSAGISNAAVPLNQIIQAKGIN